MFSFANYGVCYGKMYTLSTKLRDELASPKFANLPPYQIKGYADELSVIPSNIIENQSILTKIDEHCSELHLHLNPSKCISYCHDGSKLLPLKQFALSAGKTKNIASSPVIFLGKTISTSESRRRNMVATKLRESIASQLRKINTCRLRGKYKTWILQNYLLPSLQFSLAVNPLPACTLSSIQRPITKCLKQWLNLPICATPAVLLHKHSLNIKFLPNYSEEAQLSYLTTTALSTDKTIQDIHQLALRMFLPNCIEAYNLAKEALSHKAQVSQTRQRELAKTGLTTLNSENCEQQLHTLKVQNSLLQTIALEEANPVWKRILNGLPSGQFP